MGGHFLPKKFIKEHLNARSKFHKTTEILAEAIKHPENQPIILERKWKKYKNLKGKKQRDGQSS